MVVENVANKVREDGNGSKVAFSFSFKIYKTSDIKAYKVVKATGVATLMTLDVDYTVAINTATDGGVVTYTTAPTTLQESFLISDFDIEQQTDIPERGGLRESQIENAFDRAVLLIRQMAEQLARALKLPITSVFSELELPEPEAGTYLGWNDDEDALENKTITDIGLAVLATQAEAEAGTDDAALMTPLRTKQAITVLSPTDVLTAALTSGDTVATDASLVSNGGVFTLTAAHTFTLSNPTNPVDGKKLIWRIKQDATGSRVLTFGNKFKVANNVENGTIVLSTAANVIDMIGAVYNIASDLWSVVAFARNITAVT